MPSPTLSIEELRATTGEPAQRLQRLRTLKLIGSDDNGFAPADIERVHLIQFLERRQIPLETIARGERDEAVLTSVVEFLYPRGVGRRYSFAEAVEIAGLDADVVRRLREASAPSDELMDEHDIRMLAEAKVALDAGFPEAALLQLVRVYADALGRVAEAEVRLFHFYVHEGLKATGLAGSDLLDSRRAVRDHLLPIVEPLIRFSTIAAWQNRSAKTWFYISWETGPSPQKVSRRLSSGSPLSSSTSRATRRLPK